MKKILKKSLPKITSPTICFILFYKIICLSRILCTHFMNFFIVQEKISKFCLTKRILFVIIITSKEKEKRKMKHNLEFLGGLLFGLELIAICLMLTIIL